MGLWRAAEVLGVLTHTHTLPGAGGVGRSTQGPGCRTRVHLLRWSLVVCSGKQDGMLPGPHPPPATLSHILKPENPHSSGRHVGSRHPAEPKSTELRWARRAPLGSRLSPDTRTLIRSPCPGKGNELERPVIGQPWGHEEKGRLIQHWALCPAAAADAVCGRVLPGPAWVSADKANETSSTGC